MVAIKIAAILIFVLGAARAVNTANWHPFLPNGFSGAHRLGHRLLHLHRFDSVSTAAEECRNPQRDLPFGIIMTLVICAVLYISVALVLTGIAPWRSLTGQAPVADALKAWVQRNPAVGEYRGHFGDALVAAGISIRAGADLVCDVPRRAAAESILEGAPGV